MSDQKSALPGARHDGLVTVTEAGLRGMITLKGDLASDAVKHAATSATGTDMPGMRGITTAGSKGLAWMAPDEVLILLPRGDTSAALAAIAEALKDEHHLAADVSDARALFTLEGPKVREVLAKLAPADLSPKGLPPGEIRRTRVAQVAAAIWFESDTKAHLICFRSVAEYVFGLLSNAADPAAPVDHF
ncbi:sarcosine oxidase subunit gamma [Ovoidimarina sediminis]|uniref:sarcosine oxidase subunit gamma n=1 Tax=Ovoidimarina sediminis TaxID=3079856 RepID=UPI00290A6917|nr:sarcosine oxidase subunit gamma family protein [Rhodophyticola sp. MJ-SS7]MDU8943219.1 sarcosine oxidase subunit gamma family protein [Rhodophyticola sp. MJ-SS7]